MIRRATADDIDAIARLHGRVLDWSINGRLGTDHLRTMYGALFRGDDIVAFVAEYKAGLAGFMVATSDLRQARSRMRRVLGFRGMARILLGSSLHPADWIDLLETATVVPRAMRRVRAAAELLAWVSDPALAIGRVAAYRCMMATLDEMERRGHRRCYAQVLRSNHGPHEFHRRLGSRVTAKFIRNVIYEVDCTEARRSALSPGRSSTRATDREMSSAIP